MKILQCFVYLCSIKCTQERCELNESERHGTARRVPLDSLDFVIQLRAKWSKSIKSTEKINSEALLDRKIQKKWKETPHATQKSNHFNSSVFWVAPFFLGQKRPLHDNNEITYHPNLYSSLFCSFQEQQQYSSLLQREFYYLNIQVTKLFFYNSNRYKSLFCCFQVQQQFTPSTPLLLSEW